MIDSTKTIRVNVWNVGHGEAIRIDIGDRLSVVRDFGRAASAEKTTTSFDLDHVIGVPIISPKRTTDAVLSHAHEDHFNGFQKLYHQGHRQIFENCFIPWLDFDTVRSLGWQMTILGAYLYAYYGPNTPASQTTKNWALAAPVMGALGRSIRGVAAGYTFPWGVKNKVLWPPKPQFPGWRGQVLDPVRESVRAIERLLISTQQLSIVRTVTKSTRQICRMLRPYYSKTESPTQNHSVNVETIGSLLDGLVSLQIRPNEEIENEFLRAVFVRHFGLDDHSIVFEFPDRALFLSDLNGSPMDLMAKMYMRRRRQYKLLKSAHHGTRLGNYDFARAVTRVDRVLHCCGPANSSYNGPITDYVRFAPKCIISTDHHPAGASLDQFPDVCNCCFNSPRIVFRV